MAQFEKYFFRFVLKLLTVNNEESLKKICNEEQSQY